MTFLLLLLLAVLLDNSVLYLLFGGVEDVFEGCVPSARGLMWE